MVEDHKEPDKKIAILEATLELIAENGFHHTPTSQIAEKARVGVGSLYRYFQDKDEIIHELFRYVGRKQSLVVLKEHNPEAPFREQYIHLCTKMIEYAVEHPNETRFMDQYFNSPYGISQRRDALLKQEFHNVDKPPLAIFFEKAKAQQIVKDLPPFVLGALTFGALFGLVHDILAGVLDYDAELMHKAVEACWDAVKR